MAAWSHGYNTSEGYTFGYYREVSPHWIDFSLYMRGIQAPRSNPGQSFGYLELGCGQGFGLCLLAAANPDGRFVGIDFSPVHIAHARELAGKLALTNVSFLEGDFAELASDWPRELGRFNYIILHGIFSWVAPPIRAAIVACLERASEPGAAVYLAYNSMPGWLSSVPFQHITRLIEQTSGAAGVSAIEAGRSLFKKLHAIESAVSRSLPDLERRVENTSKQPAAYLVQEYLHENWHPLWGSTVARELSDAKLEPAASATLPENLLPGVLPPAMRELLSNYTEPSVRSDLIDCLINQSFRRDIYCRGARKLFDGDTAWLRHFRVLRTNRTAVPAEIRCQTAFGTLTVPAKNYAAIFANLDQGATTLATMLADLAGVAREQFLQTMVLLIHSGWLSVVWQPQKTTQSAKTANACIVRAAAEGAPYRYVVAPQLGAAIGLSDTEMFLLDGHLNKPDDFSREPAGLLIEALRVSGRTLARNGSPLTAKEEEAEVNRRVDDFRERLLPLLRILGVF